MGLDIRESGCEADMIMPTVQMRTLRFREGKRLAQVTQHSRD